MAFFFLAGSKTLFINPKASKPITFKTSAPNSFAKISMSLAKSSLKLISDFLVKAFLTWSLTFCGIALLACTALKNCKVLWSCIKPLSYISCIIAAISGV